MHYVCVNFTHLALSHTTSIRQAGQRSSSEQRIESGRASGTAWDCLWSHITFGYRFPRLSIPLGETIDRLARDHLIVDPSYPWLVLAWYPCPCSCSCPSPCPCRLHNVSCVVSSHGRNFARWARFIRTVIAALPVSQSQEKPIRNRRAFHIVVAHRARDRSAVNVNGAVELGVVDFVMPSATATTTATTTTSLSESERDAFSCC